MGYQQERHLNVIPQNCQIQNPGTCRPGNSWRPHLKWKKSETEEKKESVLDAHVLAHIAHTLSLASYSLVRSSLCWTTASISGVKKQDKCKKETKFYQYFKMQQMMSIELKLFASLSQFTEIIALALCSKLRSALPFGWCNCELLSNSVVIL